MLQAKNSPFCQYWTVLRSIVQYSRSMTISKTFQTNSHKFPSIFHQELDKWYISNGECIL